MEDDLNLEKILNKETLDLKHLTKSFKKVPDEYNEFVENLSKPHVESFNYAMDEGLKHAVQCLTEVKFRLPNESLVTLKIEEMNVDPPKPTVDASILSRRKVYPSECRLNGSTYKGRLTLKVKCTNDQRECTVQATAGDIPIMVKSSKCNLHGLSPAQMVEQHEEAEDFGGYFIVNGIEKILRMLIVPRRNYPVVMSRSGWSKRGKLFTDAGVNMRCARKDQSAVNMTLHYLKNKTMRLMTSVRKEMFFIPLGILLKALAAKTDKDIYNWIVKGNEDKPYYREYALNMLRQLQDEGLLNQPDNQKFLGQRYRAKLSCPDSWTDIQVCKFFFKEYICVHLENDMEKFGVLIHMARKLLAYVHGECVQESADNLMNHEILLPGHLITMVIKEHSQLWLRRMKTKIEMEAKKTPNLTLNGQNLERFLRSGFDIGRMIEGMISTGNLKTDTGLGLQHTNGMSIVADKLNYLRYISHFRSVHRGSFFTEMRTTTARKLLPESWGFLCPVHTPDGAPCGLLNHLTASCQVVTDTSKYCIKEALCSKGMTPVDWFRPLEGDHKNLYQVHLDGSMVGYIEIENVEEFLAKLRRKKCQGNSGIPKHLEICFAPYQKDAGMYPGVYLFSGPARLMRPVKNLSQNGLEELVGTMEQVYLGISVSEEERLEMAKNDEPPTHEELQKISILSFMANLIPFSDHNQSPRNMYQCQMGKQTMGTPCHSLRYRTDNKMYRLQTPQAPLFRTKAYSQYEIDNYPLGTNAVVAVISYTGYDMEDAMIINKSSYDRGFAHGQVLKNEFVNLLDKEKKPVKIFGRIRSDARVDGLIDEDGFAFVGTFLTCGDPLYCTIDVATHEMQVVKYHHQESAYLEAIVVSPVGRFDRQKACFKFRMPRNPSIGDKFASRHGQKGICSMLWPQVDMPFTESGMTPDIIFNPHGFPSRMTIGMMIESMAGKAGALYGFPPDATPFESSEDKPAAHHFGQLLRASGYNYYGNETLYSGVTGRELEAEIFTGVVYYQRLRHMVADKFQVRSTGPVDILTRQPVKGRKRGGGIRFGEMERDSLIAHGTALLLQDRLFNCSDKHLAHICAKCGGLLSVNYEIPELPGGWHTTDRMWTCLICRTPKYVKPIYIPYVLRYFINELLSVNVKVVFYLKDIVP